MIVANSRHALGWRVLGQRPSGLCAETLAEANRQAPMKSAS